MKWIVLHGLSLVIAIIYLIRVVLMNYENECDLDSQKLNRVDDVNDSIN